MRAIIINPADNVAVAVESIIAGKIFRAGEQEITAKTNITAGHKIAIKDIPAGGDVIKYGYPIGRATADART